MAAQDQYNDAFKQTQDTLTSTFDAWTRAFQQGLSQQFSVFDRIGQIDRAAPLTNRSSRIDLPSHLGGYGVNSPGTDE